MLSPGEFFAWRVCKAQACGAGVKRAVPSSPPHTNIRHMMMTLPRATLIRLKMRDIPITPYDDNPFTTTHVNMTHRFYHHRPLSLFRGVAGEVSRDEGADMCAGGGGGVGRG